MPVFPASAPKGNKTSPGSWGGNLLVDEQHAGGTRVLNTADLSPATCISKFSSVSKRAGKAVGFSSRVLRLDTPLRKRAGAYGYARVGVYLHRKERQPCG